MKHRLFIVVAVVGLMLVAFSGYVAFGQGNEGEGEPIITTATDSVGVGTYVAAQAFAFPAGEDPAAVPQTSVILPYGIYPNMQVMSVEDFVQPEPLIEGFTFAWALTPAEGSAATLLTAADANVAIFQTDVQGAYDLTLTATAADGTAAESTWTVYATTYVGSGYLDGPEDAQDQCIDCHDDVAAAWLQTGHATFFTRAIDGGAGDHYSEACITCHTTGFNPGKNGGFDDVASAAGWTFPETLQEGNWQAMVEQYPEVAALANIQCESCHGPGYLHINEGSRNESMIGTGLSYGTCAQCHAEDPYHVFPQQWENSAHGRINAEAYTYPTGEDHQACVRCHSGVGFVDFAAGLPQEEWRTDYQPITCAVCHDPHDVTNPNQLRVFDTVTLPSGYEVTGAGPSATCMSCHNGRVDATASVTAAVGGERFSTPHYSVAAELLTASGGYTWGETLPTSAHGTAIENSCVSCHMSGTPGMDDMGTPDDASDDQPLPGHNEVGQHSFAMVSEDGVENTAACQSCHAGLTSFDRDAFRDYDGDGTIETDVAEVNGLLELIRPALEESGVTVLDSYPYFQFPESGADENVYGAVFNYKFVQGAGGAGIPAAAVHNLRYTVALLQLTYEKLTGSPVPDAYILERGTAAAMAQ
jgi:hypothetical protein